jgi:hypothetical protein
MTFAHKAMLTDALTIAKIRRHACLHRLAEIGTKTPMGKFRAMLLLGVLFLASFLIAYLTISLLPFAYYPERVYSSPSLDVPPGPKPQGIYLGPGPGAANVPRDTAILVYQLRAESVKNLVLNPETPIAYETQELDPPASRLTSFFPADLLQPETTYNVSVLIAGRPFSWNFTTSAEPSSPQYSVHLAPQSAWVAVSSAIVATSIAGLVFWARRKRESKIMLL